MLLNNKSVKNNLKNLHKELGARKITNLTSPGKQSKCRLASLANLRSTRQLLLFVWLLFSSTMALAASQPMAVITTALPQLLKILRT